MLSVAPYRLWWEYQDSNPVRRIKSPLHIRTCSTPVEVPPTGFEPALLRLKVGCLTIQPRRQGIR